MSLSEARIQRTEWHSVSAIVLVIKLSISSVIIEWFQHWELWQHCQACNKVSLKSHQKGLSRWSCG